jgi:zinc protease
MVFEDKVQLPRLYITWPTVPDYTRMGAVLEVLGHILTHGKTSRLYQALVYDRQIAQSVTSSEDGLEIAGDFQIQATAKPEKGLTPIEAVIDSILDDIRQNGVTKEEIAKAITSEEVKVINNAATELGKAVSLAFYYSYTGDPENFNHQLDLYEGISQEEILSVARKFLAGPRIVLSVVPVGKQDLAAQKGE